MTATTLDRRPDYERIARLELELYGRCFEHAGSDVIIVHPRIPPPRGLSPLNAEQMARLAVALGNPNG